MLRAVWGRVYGWARCRSRLTPRLTLRVGCPMISRMRARGDVRAFMHTGGAHARGQVHVHPVAARLDLQTLVGLMLHEISHPLAEQLYGRSDQWDADNAARRVYKVDLSYRPPLMLERVSRVAARRILGA